MSKFYKIYTDAFGWEMIGCAETPLKAYRTVANHYDGSSTFMIIEHDTELDMDSSYRLITSEQKLLQFKQEVTDVSQRTPKLYKIKKL